MVTWLQLVLLTCLKNISAVKIGEAKKVQASYWAT